MFPKTKIYKLTKACRSEVKSRKMVSSEESQHSFIFIPVPFCYPSCPGNLTEIAFYLVGDAPFNTCESPKRHFSGNNGLGHPQAFLSPLPSISTSFHARCFLLGDVLHFHSVQAARGELQNPFLWAAVSSLPYGGQSCPKGPTMMTKSNPWLYTGPLQTLCLRALFKHSLNSSS